MLDLRDLYQELILDHNRSPRNFGELEPCSHMADGYNPLCGDKVKVFLLIDDAEVIRDIRFSGAGCAISTASASVMTEALKGKSVSEARGLFDSFHDLVTGGEADLDVMGKLAVFSGVSEYPARVKCASLCWHTVKAAFEGPRELVTTE